MVRPGRLPGGGSGSAWRLCWGDLPVGPRLLFSAGGLWALLVKHLLKRTCRPALTFSASGNGAIGWALLVLSAILCWSVKYVERNEKQRM